MATVELELELFGSAEGVPAEILGHGSVDTDAGRIALDVRLPRRLLLFDPALVALGVLDVFAVACIQPGEILEDRNCPANCTASLGGEFDGVTIRPRQLGERRATAAA
jgi:hypothetical protein